jgi:mono/diheme cytochrome c family protein
MSAPKPIYAADNAPIHGILAEFDAVDPLMHACETVRDAGYTVWDAHTPFPVHGLDGAMGVRPTRLPWLILLAGITGMSSGLLMQWWMNSIDYPFRISGKPMFSLPAFIPVCFELTVLLSGFAAFFGSLALNKLPNWFHPLFLNERFKRATNDRFFVYIESKDPIFDAERVQRLLEGTQPLHMETVHYEAEGVHTWFPQGTAGIAAILVVLSIAPFAMFAKARVTTSLLPPLHLNPPAPIKDDMDFQYKFKPQAPNWFFEDGRAMRPFPDGAVAEEDPAGPTPFYTGRHNPVTPAPQAPVNVAPELRAHGQRGNTNPEPKPGTTTAPQAVAAGYVTEIPSEVAVNRAAMERGQQRFNIYCAPCHGISGYGDGMVARHADRLQEGTWVSPTSLHEARVRSLPVGDIYNTVTHGIRNMPGYGHLIEPEDRWAIVMYVRALQLSQHAPKSDVPPNLQSTLQ